MNISIATLIQAATEASERAAAAAAACPPRRIVIRSHEDRALLLTAASLERQERAAWAFACQEACSIAGDSESARRIDPHMVDMGIQQGWMTVEGMHTEQLRELTLRHAAQLA